jgi:hypothetical protein
MILKDSETELVGGLAVADTYLVYSTALTAGERERLLLGSGTAWRELREAGPSNNFAVPGDRSEMEVKLASVREYLEFFPFHTVRDGTLNIDDGMFMECLINNILNEIVSYQTFVLKNSKKQKAALKSRIRELKLTDPPGSERILELEKNLTSNWTLKCEQKLKT